jgi:hypothetical protein
VPFRPEDIEPAGYVPNTTAIAYTIACDGEIIGRVHAPQAPGWLNAGLDPREKIADRLNATEESVGFEQLAEMLRKVLDLG